MNVKWAGCSLALALTSISLFSAASWAGQVQDFVATLKQHYQHTSEIKAFSIRQHYLQNSLGQAWDYLAPNRWTAMKVTEFDLEKKHYVENVIHHFTGGVWYDEVHFQNDQQSLRYERNGTTLGKKVLEQSMGSFDRYKNLYLANIDFLAVTPLLQETDLSKMSVVHEKKSGKTRLTYVKSNKNVKEYVFNRQPLRLYSIDDKSRGRVSIYTDYQTSRGFTFARSIDKYYKGEANPRFIKRIDDFELLEGIEPHKLQLPAGFGPVLAFSDRKPILKKLGVDLYLITNAAGSRNNMLQVKGDELMLFGGPSSSRLAQETLDFLAKRFPQKKLTSVYVTHPHSDHIDGLSVYVDFGAHIYADAYSIAAIKAYPDFAEFIAGFKFKTIGHNQLLHGARFYVLENSHSKRQSFVHFEAMGIIYQADFMDIPVDNTMPKVLPNYSKTFSDFVLSQKLNVNRIIGHSFNNNIGSDLLQKIATANIL